ncbi:DUF2332 family protein [Kitasatospora sp. NPDC001159]
MTDADEARWLRACLWPDQPERAAKLDAELALAATAPPLLLTGDVVEVMPDAFARVPADALPVVTTAWALSRFSLESRLRFLHRLDEAATDRAVAWVSAEGVGVAPTIPTFGDRRASATASSAWRCSSSRLCAPRPSAAAGRRAACCRGWQTPSSPLGGFDSHFLPESEPRCAYRYRRHPCVVRDAEESRRLLGHRLLAPMAG